MLNNPIYRSASSSSRLPLPPVGGDYHALMERKAHGLILFGLTGPIIKLGNLKCPQGGRRIQWPQPRLRRLRRHEGRVESWRKLCKSKIVSSLYESSSR